MTTRAMKKIVADYAQALADAGAGTLTNIGPRGDTALVVPANAVPKDGSTIADLLKTIDIKSVPSLFDSLPPVSATPRYADIFKPTAQSRPHHKAASQPVTTNLQIDIKSSPALDLKVLETLRKQMDDYSRRSLMASLYGGNLSSMDLPDFSREAAEAYRAAGYDYDLGDVLDERPPPEALQRWIWGPLGEFTGFAQVEAIFEKLRRIAFNTQVEQSRVINLDAFLSGEFYQITKPWHRIAFKVTVKAHPDQPNAGLYKGWVYTPQFDKAGLRRTALLTLVQFATYADQMAWEEMAQGLVNHVRGLRYAG